MIKMMTNEIKTNCTAQSRPRLGMIFLKMRSEMKATKAASKLKLTKIPFTGRPD